MGARFTFTHTERGQRARARGPTDKTISLRKAHTGATPRGCVSYTLRATGQHLDNLPLSGLCHTNPGAEFVMSRKVLKSPSQSYTIKLAEPHQLADVLRIMRENFYHEETMFRSLCSSVSMTDSEKICINEYFDGTIEAAFNASPCVIAIDDETSKIVGANITALSENPKTGNDRDGLATIFSSKKSVPPLVEKYIEYLSKFNDEAKLFEKFPNAQAMWEFYAIAIDKNHRKLGLASDLMEVGVALAREAKVALVFGVFTSMYSRKSAENVGMKTVMEFDLSAYKDVTGTSVFKDTEPHNIVSVMVLEI